MLAKAWKVTSVLLLLSCFLSATRAHSAIQTLPRFKVTKWASLLTTKPVYYESAAASQFFAPEEITAASRVTVSTTLSQCAGVVVE